MMFVGTHKNKKKTKVEKEKLRRSNKTKARSRVGTNRKKLKMSFQHEKINPQKDFSVSECVWCYADNNSCFIALIFKIIKTSFQRYSLKKYRWFLLNSKQ